MREQKKRPGEFDPAGHSYTKTDYDQAAEFLQRHGMLFSGIDPKAELDKFLAQMERDYQDHAVCGRMIPLYLGDYHAPSADRLVTVIDIGGTNVRSAVVTLGPRGLKNIGKIQSSLTPGVREETDTAHFFSEIVSAVKENLICDEIGICFSLATVPQPDRDAVMIAGGKQIKVCDMLGKKVGESFREAMHAQHLPIHQRITVINDTVAAAMGGHLLPESSRYSGFVGFIYGTGINICLCAPSGELINAESGGYCGFPAGDIDDVFDRTLIDTGCDRFEKMVSGGYQGGLMREILSACAAENVFSPEGCSMISSALCMNSFSLSSKDISFFAKDPNAEDGLLFRLLPTQKDRRILAAVCDLITMRSARLCAIALTGALLHSGRGVKTGTPAFITAEGSTYLKQKDFRELLDQQMHLIAGEMHGLSFEIRNLPDATLQGTAAACLAGT